MLHDGTLFAPLFSISSSFILSVYLSVFVRVFGQTGVLCKGYFHVTGSLHKRSTRLFGWHPEDEAGTGDGQVGRGLGRRGNEADSRLRSDAAYCQELSRTSRKFSCIFVMER